MIIIAGLGNPGEKYSNTKHNLGFITVDLLAERNGIKISKLKHRALVGEGMIAGKKVMLVKPQTWMNESGRSVQTIVKYYDIKPEDLFVVYDDVDIPMGSLRIRKQGSAGSHNGMKSIIYLLESDSFPRFRLGIGTESPAPPLRDYVLSGFEKEDIDIVRSAVIRCAEAIEAAVKDGIETAMLNYNTGSKNQANETNETDETDKPDDIQS